MTDTYLRDVLDLPESVHAGDYKIELTGGFTAQQTADRVREYVVTPQLATAFGDALDLVRSGVRTGNSYAAYLHGSFGSGKSHFLTVLHAVLNGDSAARDKPSLQPVIAPHDGWLRDKRFLMVPYHLIGAADLDSALLGGYVATVAERHPDAPPPAVYRSDAMLDDARTLRSNLGDDAFIGLLGAPGTSAADDDGLDVIGEADGGGWDAAALDAAFAAPQGDQRRRALESALLAGPLSAYARGTRGDRDAYLPLDDGLSVITDHAKSLGYDGVVLFLDELILWLQAHMTNREFVDTQVSKLVKLIESGVAHRAVPIISFISRQRDLSQLVGEDVTGADVKNLETQVSYLAERFSVVSLEDSNLPAIVRERVLKPRAGKEHLLDEAFASIESSRPGDRDVLLDATGVTEASWDDFKQVYPLSPALLNVLVVLAGALQRERTGLKLLQEMLHRRRGDMKLGQLIPLGDLWDVLTDGTGAAFSSTLRKEADAGKRFHDRVRAHLLGIYGSDTDPRYVAADRFVKTMLLASLARDVPALTRLTGARLAALNLGSIRSRTAEPGQLVVTRLRELQAEFGELRSEGDKDPVFALHLSDLDLDPILDSVGEQDNAGARRIWVKNRLWSALGVPDQQAFVSERDHVWRGTRRTVEFVFGNVRDATELSEAQFRPGTDGRVRFVFDYPFDESGRFPSDDVQRVENLRRGGIQEATLVWIPHFLTEQRTTQLGRLIKISWLLESNRLDEFAAHLSGDDRIRVRVQLQAQRDNLTSQLSAALDQAYGIARADTTSVRIDLDDGVVSTLSLLPGHQPRLAGGAPLAQNVETLADGLFATLYPRHPDFDPAGKRKALTLGELRTVHRWITEAMSTGDRRTEVASKDLQLVRRVVHGLGLGEVADGPLYLHVEWKQRIEQHAASLGVTGDYPVDAMRGWIAELAGPGLERPVANLVVATYALLADRAWIRHGAPADAPDLDRMGAGDALRAQELPDPAEFALARDRAATLFGVTVPEPLFARNVALLATRVQEQVARSERGTVEVWEALVRHTDDLGVPRDAPRITTARAAADLLATLSATAGATALVRALANAGAPDVSDQTLGAAIASASAVRDGLAAVQWPLLGSALGLQQHPTVGERAQQLATRLRSAVGAEEFTTALAPVLREASNDVVAIIAAATPRPPVVPDPVGPGPVVPRPGPADPVPPPTGGGTPQPGRDSGRRELTAAGLDALLTDLRAEIGAHPRRRYEVIWRVVEEGSA
ncbi:PglY protein [Pseudonocardia tropica]|uniref:PglY protein n=1 Tax=Pseudonocardia tropica TaxID=681289 RepID=A0ABV1JSI0_9PSEU